MNKQSSSVVAYCGLICTDCFVYKMTISEAAKALRREMRTAKLKEVWHDIPFLGEYGPFKKSLDGLAALRCARVCRDGGGNPWCKIRKCCQKKELECCWECEEVETCNKLVERYRKNMRMIKKLGVEGFLVESRAK
jgi:hypothetical protein